MSKKITGQCLCGTVVVTANTAPEKLDACHCGMCRRWAGGPLLAMDCGTDVSIDGADKVTVFNSSEWAERGFCSRCGTHIYYRLKEQNQYMMPPGLFKDLGAMNFETEIFIDEKPAYYSFANDTKKMTGAEFFAQYAPST